MSFVGSLFSGSQGAGFQAERAATPEQAQQLYEQQQERLRQQQLFTQQLMAQSPEAIAQQRALASQLAAQAQGKGPSVARTQLAQTTGENIAAQQALMAGQRGASANVGAMARQAGLLGARTQQQAAGQAATLRAQEQLAAQQQLAGITGQQLGQVAGAQQLGLQGVGAAQQNILDAIARRNATQAAIASGNQQFQSQLVGGLLGGAATALGAPGMAEGGEVNTQDDDEENDSFYSSFSRAMSPSKEAMTPVARGGQQMGQAIGKGIRGLLSGKKVSGQPSGGYSGANLGVKTQMPQMINPMATSGAIGAFKPGLAKGGKVPAMVSPGEKYLPPHEVKKVAQGKSPMAAGKTIPGQAKVHGDSYANDTVPATLEEGGIVIPRSVVQSENPEEKARRFVAAVLAKKQHKRK